MEVAIVACLDDFPSQAISAIAKENMTVFLKQYSHDLEVGGFEGASTPTRQEGLSLPQCLLSLCWYHK